ncbi:MAG: biopolymer transporter ExbD [Desulfuromonadales bacterium]|nr:biopolymer transporter ExbD [Desulfuromonadales bacterium]
MEEKQFDYINIIPFVDIMLVLLTIVLTTSTFIASGGIPVNLPRASRNSQEIVRTRTIEIDRSGTIIFDGHIVTTATLRPALQPLDKNTPFLIRADRDIPLQVFVDALDTVKNSGFSRVSLQTETRQ